VYVVYVYGKRWSACTGRLLGLSPCRQYAATPAWPDLHSAVQNIPIGLLLSVR
jgi:hypothetical protein